MLTLNQKKQLYNALVGLQKGMDAIYIPLDGELALTKNVGRIAIIVGGMAATIVAMLDSLEDEIKEDWSRIEMERRAMRMPPEMGSPEEPPPMDAV